MSEFIKKVKMRRNLLIILGAVIACLLISIPLVDKASTQVIDMQPGESKTIEIKKNKKLKVNVDKKKVYVSSSNPDVAEIKKNIIRTKDVGVAKVTVMGTGVESELNLIVKNNLNDPNPPMDDLYVAEETQETENVDATQPDQTQTEQAETNGQDVQVDSSTQSSQAVMTDQTVQNTASTVEPATETQADATEVTSQVEHASTDTAVQTTTDSQTETPASQETVQESGRVELTAEPEIAEKTGYDLSDRIWDDEIDLPNLIYIIGAVESGGQVYGNRDYGCYIEPKKNSKKEKTITIGWPQFYGNNARDLLKKIYKTDKELFLSIDRRKSVKKMLKKNWEKKKWKPNEAQKKIIIELITSKVGKECQDTMFLEEMVDYVKYCKKRFTDNAWAIHMYCEIAHLGGEKNARRIFKACMGNYTLDNIMAVLKEDQNNKKDNEVGDEVYWDRHEVCCDFLQRNCAEENPTEKKNQQNQP